MRPVPQSVPLQGADLAEHFPLSLASRQGLSQVNSPYLLLHTSNIHFSSPLLTLLPQVLCDLCPGPLRPCGGTGQLPQLWQYLDEISAGLLSSVPPLLTSTFAVLVSLKLFPLPAPFTPSHLQEGVTGTFTGSMYNDISLRKKGLYGEGVPQGKI